VNDGEQGRANAGLDRIPDSVMIILGKVRPLSRRLAEPHPQVLIIAPLDVGVERGRAAISCRVGGANWERFHRSSCLVRSSWWYPVSTIDCLVRKWLDSPRMSAAQTPAASSRLLHE
jgi:hypothetical protein